MTYQKKYLSLAEAAVISGYSQKELRAMLKLGLFPSRRRGSSITIPTSAFERIGRDAPRRNSLIIDSKQSSKIKKIKNTSMSLTTPVSVSIGSYGKYVDPRLLKILEPISFTAALVMTLHLALVPVYAERIVGSLGTVSNTVAFMGDAATTLVTTGVALPVQVAQGAGSVAIAAVAPGVAFQPTFEGQIAGTATLQDVSVPLSVVETQSGVEAALIGIADASDSFQRFLNTVSAKTMQVLVYNNTFEHWDGFVNQFRW